MSKPRRAAVSARTVTATAATTVTKAIMMMIEARCGEGLTHKRREAEVRWSRAEANQSMLAETGERRSSFKERRKRLGKRREELLCCRLCAQRKGSRTHCRSCASRSLPFFLCVQAAFFSFAFCLLLCTLHGGTRGEGGKGRKRGGLPCRARKKDEGSRRKSSPPSIHGGRRGLT